MYGKYCGKEEKRGENAPKEQFLLFSTIFCCLMIDLSVKTGTRFSLRDKPLFEISEFEITRVDLCYLYIYGELLVLSKIKLLFCSIFSRFHCFPQRLHSQGPVVQSVVSLTSSLRIISLTVLADSIYNILIFFAEQMWVAFALQKLLTFFPQKISAYLRITHCKF